MAKANTEDLLEQFKGMTLLELSEFIKKFEERYGVTAAAPVAVAAAPAATDAVAETTEAFFSRNDFFPFTRDELKQHDPLMFAVVAKLWGAAGAPAAQAFCSDYCVMPASWPGQLHINSNHRTACRSLWRQPIP